MLKKFLCSAAAVAALALVVPIGDAKAATIAGFYSLNGGATINPLADLDPSGSGFAFVGALGNFNVNILGSTVQPDAGTDLLTATAIDSHRGTATETLKLYFVGSGFTPGGSQTFTSQFSSNATGSGLTVAESSYLGTAFAPGTLLGSASFPPLLGTASSVTSAFVALGYSLTGEIDFTATGVKSQTGTVRVSAVPGPIVGAGLPGLIAACGGLLALARRRRKEAA